MIAEPDVRSARQALIDAELMAYWPRMVGYARRFLVEADHTDWEDTAAAALESALRHSDSIGASLEGWLMQAVRWHALTTRDRLRREAGRRADAATLPELRRARVDAGSSSHVTALVVRDAVATLPPTLRRHAEARMTGRSLREVGEALGHTKETAYHHEVAMKQAIRASLSGHPVEAVRLSPKPRPSGRSCTVDGCAAALLARGQCRRHYLQQWRAKTGPDQPTLSLESIG